MVERIHWEQFVSLFDDPIDTCSVGMKVGEGEEEVEPASSLTKLNSFDCC